MEESIGIRELKAHASEILKGVRADGASYTVTHHGQAIARLIPLLPPRSLEEDSQPFAGIADILAAFDALAADIAQQLPRDEAVSALALVRDQRREP